MIMKNLYKQLFLFTILLSGTVALHAQESEAFVHESTVGNSVWSWTQISEPTLDGQPATYPIFIHNFNPGGGSGTYADSKMSMWYNGGHWNIFNEDGSTFGTNKAFNVLAPGPDVKSWKHTAAPGNISQNSTLIDDPLINGDSNAIVLISGAWDSTYNTNVNGVYYSTSEHKWRIFNQEGLSQAMPEGTSFNVIVPKTSNKYVAFVHNTDPNNTSTYITTLDHPGLNNNPDAIVFVTSNYNPGASTGVYNNHNVGVYYNGVKWCIYNEDKVALPTGASFNVLAFKLNAPTFIDNNLTTTDVKVFPNPASVHDPITITLDEQLQGNVRIKLIGMDGTCVYDETIIKNNGRASHQIQTLDISRGLYIIQIENGERVGTQKLIIQ